MFGIENYSEAIVKYGSEFDVSQLGKAALFGGAMVLIGMATIFAVLILLWACLALFKVVFHDLPAKKAASANETEVSSPVLPVAATATSDDEIVAVIAAAIAMAESENSGLKFRVVSFKRK